MMQVRFRECSNSDMGLFADMAQYPDVSDWVRAIGRGEAQFVPMDVMVRFNRNWHSIVYCGLVSPDFEQTADAISELDEDVRMLPNDNAVITADGFEGELHIDLDGE